MTVSLDNAYIATCLQGLEALGAILKKAEAHCTEHGIAPEELTGARLAEDMWPLSKQVFEVGHHSARAIPAVRERVFGPELEEKPGDFASLHAEVASSIAALKAVPAGELDAIAGEPMRFEFRDFKIPFTVENFLFSFSLPNFFFHLTTTYDILRMKGVKVGKFDFIGPARALQG